MEPIETGYPVLPPELAPLTDKGAEIKTVLHIASATPASSNRLALQLAYSRGAWRNELLHLTATLEEVRKGIGDDAEAFALPHKPRFRRDDPVLIRRLRSLMRRLSNLVSLYWLLLRSRADLLHAHQHTSLWSIAFWSVILRRPAVWDPHDYFHEGERIRSRLGRHNVKEFLERRVASRRVPILVVSNGMKRRFREMYPETRIEVLKSYSAVQHKSGDGRAPEEIAVRRNRLSGDKVRVVYPGIVGPERIELSTFETIGRSENIVFDVYGVDRTREYRREVEEAIEEYGFRNIHFRGSYSPDDICSILTDYHFALFPFPILRENIDFCLPNKFFQCIESALPIISTNTEEMGAIIENHGLGHVYAYTNQSALADILARGTGSDDEYAELIANVVEYRSSAIDYAGQRSTMLDAYDAAIARGKA